MLLENIAKYLRADTQKKMSASNPLGNLFPDTVTYSDDIGMFMLCFLYSLHTMYFFFIFFFTPHSLFNIAGYTYLKGDFLRHLTSNLL